MVFDYATLLLKFKISKQDTKVLHKLALNASLFLPPATLPNILHDTPHMYQTLSLTHWLLLKLHPLLEFPALAMHQ